VLDVGTGAGRVALELQKRGHPVVAIDNSPLAIATAKRRGVNDARVIALADVGRRLGTFDSIVMYGNNFGLVGTPRRAKKILRALAAMTSPNARILAQTIDPYTSKDATHVAYRARNRRRGRPAGQIRIRARFGTAATPWLDLLLVSPTEMASIAEDGGWRVKAVLKGGHVYIGVLEKR
jgi:cyclopropane fatty-acyl-phospholipid synthase-like methyltransferase